MKGNIARLLCAFLLLLIGMGMMAGLILAIPAEETLTSWTKISFQTGGKQWISLYDSGGKLIDRMTTDDTGKCTTTLLEEGSYYGVCNDGLVAFRLTSRGIAESQGGAVVTDKYSLSFILSQQGRVQISGEAREEWYTYELRSPEYSCHRVLRCEPGDSIVCTIENLPYGEYALLENNRILCYVQITEKNPLVEVSLP